VPLPSGSSPAEKPPGSYSRIWRHRWPGPSLAGIRLHRQGIQVAEHHRLGDRPGLSRKTFAVSRTSQLVPGRPRPVSTTRGGPPSPPGRDVRLRSSRGEDGQLRGRPPPRRVGNTPPGALPKRPPGPAGPVGAAHPNCLPAARWRPGGTRQPIQERARVAAQFQYEGAGTGGEPEPGLPGPARFQAPRRCRRPSPTGRRLCRPGPGSGPPGPCPRAPRRPPGIVAIQDFPVGEVLRQSGASPPALHRCPDPGAGPF